MKSIAITFIYIVVVFSLSCLSHDAYAFDASSGELVTSHGAMCDGSTNDATAFNSTDSYLGTPQGAIVVPRSNSPCVIGTTATLHHPLLFLPGAQVNVLPGSILNLQAVPLASSTDQIFSMPSSGSGTVYIYAFNSAPLYAPAAVIYAEWWGARPDGQTSSAAGNNLALNAAVQSIANTTGGIIQLNAGRYMVDCSVGNAVTITGLRQSSTDLPVGIAGMGMNLTNVSPEVDCPSGYSVFYVSQWNGSGTFADFSVNSAPKVVPTPHFNGISFQSIGNDPSTGKTVVNGLSEVRNIAFSNVATAIWCAACADMKFDFMYATNCFSSCFKFGGGAQDNAGGQSVSLLRLDHFIMGGNAISVSPSCVLIDSGANAMVLHDITTGNCGAGILVKNSFASSGGHRPEEIHIDRFISDITNYNLDVESVWGLTLTGGYFGTAAKNVIGLGVSGTNGPDVDGIFINNSMVRGAANDGILMDHACNVFISGSTIYGNGTAGSGYAAVHATINSCGTLSILGNTLGVEEAADDKNYQQYSVILDYHSLQTTPQTSPPITNCGSAANVICVGRGIIIGNIIQGNTSGGTILNNGPSATGANLQILDNSGYNPPAIPAPVVCSTSPCIRNSGPSGELDTVTGSGITAIMIGTTSTGLLSGTFPLKPGQTLSVTYTGSVTITLFPQ